MFGLCLFAAVYHNNGQTAAWDQSYGWGIVYRPALLLCEIFT